LEKDCKSFFTKIIFTCKWKNRPFVGVNNKYFYDKEKKHIHWVPIVVKLFLCLSYHPHCHFTKWSSAWNQILFEWDRQWTHWPRCKCHHLITRCQLTSKKIKRKVEEGHEFANVKHETLHIFWWKWRYSKQHYGMQFIPHHGNNECPCWV